MELKIKEGSENYCCTVVKIKDLHLMEGCDNIQRCVVEGNDVVVSKSVKKDDIMLYFPALCRLNLDYCRYNNLFSEVSLNLDKNSKGYLNSKGRTRAIKLKNVVSQGLLMPLESLNFINEL